jgi:hypothetical protein
MSEYDPE